MNLLPEASLISNLTESGCPSGDSDGGAIDIASRKRFLMLVPNFNSASSAAFSASSIFFSRLEASDRSHASPPQTA